MGVRIRSQVPDGNSGIAMMESLVFTSVEVEVTLVIQSYSRRTLC